jgi:hypothetical protein
MCIIPIVFPVPGDVLEAMSATCSTEISATSRNADLGIQPLCIAWRRQVKRKKTEVYGAIANCPRHPLADMHGLVRVVVMAKGRHKALETLKRSGVKRMAFLQPSASVVELEALETAMERVRIIIPKLPLVLACDVRTMYLRVEYYREFKLPEQDAIRLGRKGLKKWGGGFGIDA